MYKKEEEQKKQHENKRKIHKMINENNKLFKNFFLQLLIYKFFFYECLTATYG